MILRLVILLAVTHFLEPENTLIIRVRGVFIRPLSKYLYDFSA